MRVRIVLIDDSVPVLKTLERLLRREDFEIHSFSRAALCDRCRCPDGHTCADIVVSDVSMPDHTGIEFVANQRDNGCKARHVALASGNWSEEDLERARAMCCQTFHKPFELAELVTWIEDCARDIPRDRVLDPWFLEQACESP
jgi:DNA-binding NtrC family response regulator